MSTTFSMGSVKQDLLAELEECQEMLGALAESLPDRLGDLAAAELIVRDGVREVGCKLLQGWCDAADKQMSPPRCEHCDCSMRHKGYVRSPLVTSLGDIKVRRVRYRCLTCQQECYPQDQQLKFPGHSISRTLTKVISRMGAQLPFDQARQNLALDYGVHLSKQTMQLVCEDAGNALLAAEDEQRRNIQNLEPAEQLQAMPKSEVCPENTYVFADGAMLHAEEDWREIRVAKVVSTDENDNVIAVDQRARFLSCVDFAWQLMLLAFQAGYQNAKRRVFLADGARWLWDIAATYFPDAIQILDWYHLSEHVHEVASTLHGQGSGTAKRFSNHHLKALWEGRHEMVLKELREHRKKLRSTGKRESLRKLIGYIENNRDRIDYPSYRRLGLQVGSGSVESACKNLVGIRCKQAGMRNWTRRGAEGVLRHRAALQSGNFDELWQTPL